MVRTDLPMRINTDDESNELVSLTKCARTKRQKNAKYSNSSHKKCGVTVLVECYNFIETRPGYMKSSRNHRATISYLMILCRILADPYHFFSCYLICWKNPTATVLASGATFQNVNTKQATDIRPGI